MGRSRLARLTSAIHVLRDTFVGWQDDAAARQGAALAFYALFAFAPLLILATGVAGSMFGPEAAQRQLAHQLEGLLTPEIAQALQVLVTDASTKSRVAAGSFGALASVYAGARGFFHLQATLNHMWGVRVVRDSAIGPTV